MQRIMIIHQPFKRSSTKTPRNWARNETRSELQSNYSIVEISDAKPVCRDFIYATKILFSVGYQGARGDLAENFYHAIKSRNAGLDMRMKDSRWRIIGEQWMKNSANLLDAVIKNLPLKAFHKYPYLAEQISIFIFYHFALYLW